LAGQAYHFSRE